MCFDMTGFMYVPDMTSQTLLTPIRAACMSQQYQELELSLTQFRVINMGWDFHVPHSSL